MGRTRGFTLIELLVVIGIIGVLISILIPAVQASREAARRAQCASNLRQIGLGLESYHAIRGCFPPGNVIREAGVCPGAEGTARIDTQDGANWAIHILPQLEQENLYRAYDFAAYNEGLPNRRVRETFLETFACPSDHDTRQLMVPARGPAYRGGIPYMPGSYRAVSGRSDGYRFLDSPEFATYPKHWRGAIHAVGAKGFRTESHQTVRDGSSVTLMVGESTTSSNRGWRTFWAYSYAHFSLSAVTPQPRVLLGDYDRCVAIDGPGSDKPCKRGWGCYHPGGMNFLLCDGSTRFLATTVDTQLLAELATIDGGEVANLPE